MFWKKLLDLKVEVKAFLSDYNKKPIFKKRKQNDICINVFGIHVEPLREANIDAKYV